MRTRRKHPTTIGEYIEGFPKDIRIILERIRRTVRRAAPGALETISYQMPAFKLRGKGLVYFAAYKNHIGFYPIPASIEAFKKELSPYRTGKGSARFPLDKPIPYELVRRIVTFRVKTLVGGTSGGRSRGNRNRASRR